MIISAHLNLNDEYLPFKHIVGQVILDVCVYIHVQLTRHLINVVQKNKGVKTVVNKLKTIDTKFRFFKMELLAGEPNYVVEHVGFGVLPGVLRPLTLNPAIARVKLRVCVRLCKGLLELSTTHRARQACSAVQPRGCCCGCVCRGRTFRPSGGKERMRGACE